MKQETPTPSQNKTTLTWKKLSLVFVPILILLSFRFVQTDFVSAQLNQIVQISKKILFGEYAFDFGEKDKITGKYITLSAVLEDKSIDQQIQNILQENKKSLEKFIQLEAR
jgi:hypothetical protein